MARERGALAAKALRDCTSSLAMKTAIFTLTAALVAAAVVIPARAGERTHAAADAGKGAIQAPATELRHRDLMPITRGMRPQAELRQLAALGPGRESAVPPAASKNVVIDVIVAYTKKAASHYFDIESELVDAAIEEANRSFRLSNLGHIRLRTVHAFQTSYVEDGSHFEHLWRFADKGDGYMEEVHGLRDAYRADVAILIVDDPKGCGLATRIGADADEAFAVVHHECAVADYTVAHEIGHLIGARHELSYVNDTKWRDIMGYRDSCGGCPRLPVWSNPRVFVDGEPLGTAELDNARVIAEQASRVAAFR
jgi:hypothetical protein